jgi:hypothetical protein
MVAFLKRQTHPLQLMFQQFGQLCPPLPDFVGQANNCQRKSSSLTINIICPVKAFHLTSPAFLLLFDVLSVSINV